MTADASLPPADVQCPTPPLTEEELAAMVEVFRRALMKAHAHEWTMEVVAEAAHVCARALADS